MSLLTALLLTLTLTSIFATALFTIAVLDKLRELLKTSALDAVQIWSAAQNSRLDVATRQEKLEYQVDQARLRLAAQRQRLIGPVESETNQ